jgi:hypothetical protein
VSAVLSQFSHSMWSTWRVDSSTNSLLPHLHRACTRASSGCSVMFFSLRSTGNTSYPLHTHTRTRSVCLATSVLRMIHPNTSFCTLPRRVLYVRCGKRDELSASSSVSYYESLLFSHTRVGTENILLAWSFVRPCSWCVESCFASRACFGCCCSALPLVLAFFAFHGVSSCVFS